jgi:nitrogen fixation/metabolism regulation signal transduction histidine kinase
VALGLPERPLERVARLSMTLMAVLALVTVLAVAIAMYFVANWFARPIKLMGEAMGEIAKGRFDFRIEEQRKDEFGQLYAAFDQMAQALQDRQSRVSARAEAPTVVQPREGGGGNAVPSAPTVSPQP